ncbi:hypothetical protein [Poseidonibacter ostreae]|jgi:hypothetical protein|uniref:Uncharacterized protein n=1 Tax=Poseidonibacter ostreae TaxID=2654171 RepID=A0A6L4WR39_9BACT|nr:hypothetical protein [Poseidonibacter ostreae]KAB7887259.1 hypothetical protein GBG19_11010 [Poseidonibacter ostreae]KAB7888319.1 hypothetical protein GA417_00650 [Poseidonibacter ostreae]KAB7889530.1 hypothetical protein GBG18_10915 [Poseidonibacter ostreae]MAC82925.1 hypothetical protein [Arcobacter sp.]|tara:strand:- start:8243 stop:8644 length:402 start_codon:yes stop_codon:yes gene_type:complete
MYDYDIIYIKGNPSSGLALQHDEMNKSITNLFGLHTFKSVDSNMTNTSFKIPSARVYIGFSRGSRYLKKLNKNVLKISIGGISGSGINTFINTDDKILSGDISQFSMNAHFLILKNDKIKIKELIDDFLFIKN